MRLTFKTILVIGLVVLLSACQAQTESPTAQPTGETAVAESTTAPETETVSETAGNLVVYSGRSDSLVQPIIDQFMEATGIQVEVRYGSTPEIAATLLEEGENSPADLFFAQDPGGLGAVQAAGLLSPLPEDLLAKVPARFADANGEWVGISGRARVVVYNTDLVSEADLPTDLMGFTDPRWQGKIGWAPGNGSFQAMVTAMRTMWGEEQTRTWLEGIQANEPIVFEGNAPIVQAVGAGEIEVGFVNHYYLFRFLAEEGEAFPARNYFLQDGGPGSLMMVAGAGILKTAENRTNAEQFIEFLLSEIGQQYFTSETYEYPVIAGIAISPLLPALADLDATAANIPLTDLADLAGTAALLSELGILP